MTINDREWDTDRFAFVQWKGTDVCMDLHCPACGHHCHYDATFAYRVECPKCKAIYRMSWHVEFERDDTKREHDCPPITCELDEDEPG